MYGRNSTTYSTTNATPTRGTPTSKNVNSYGIVENAYCHGRDDEPPCGAITPASTANNSATRNTSAHSANENASSR